MIYMEYLKIAWKFLWVIPAYISLALFVICIFAIHGPKEAAHVWSRNQ